MLVEPRATAHAQRRHYLEYPEETTNLPQVIDKLYQINVVSSTPRHERDYNS